ncbi:MAG: ABC transporter permease, partial [Clostridia bacterium]|nr:ABC transporter permease [Clostridia bacterium]
PGSYLFGFFYVLYNFLNIPMRMQPLVKMLPYVVTILVLLLISARKKRETQPPQSLGLSYFREDR